MKRLLVMGAALALILALAGPAFAWHGDNVTLCHATPPDTAANGWVQITVDQDGALGHAAQHSADIIPPFSDDAGDTFAGLNWDETGQAIWENGCQTIVTPTPTPTPSPEPSPTPTPEATPSPTPTPTPIPTSSPQPSPTVEPSPIPTPTPTPSPTPTITPPSIAPTPSATPEVLPPTDMARSVTDLQDAAPYSFIGLFIIALVLLYFRSKIKTLD